MLTEATGTGELQHLLAHCFVVTGFVSLILSQAVADGSFQKKKCLKYLLNKLASKKMNRAA